MGSRDSDILDQQRPTEWARDWMVIMKILGLSSIGLGGGGYYLMPFARTAFTDISKTRKEAVATWRANGHPITRRGAIASIIKACVAPAILASACEDRAQQFLYNHPGGFGSTGGGGCATVHDAHATTPSGGEHMGYWAWAHQFTAGATYTACAADIWTAKVGSPTNVLYAEIWSDSAGAVGSLISQSASVAGSSLITYTTAAAIPAVHFTGLSASLVSGTAYWIVFHPSPLGGATNFEYWGTAGDVSDAISKTTTYPTGWAAQGSNDNGCYRIYGP